VIVIFCIITFATSASAECAWVRWEHAEHKGWWVTRAVWTPLGAVATLAEREKKGTVHKRMNDALAKVEETVAKPAPMEAKA
jgi:hypothetical protein